MRTVSATVRTAALIAPRWGSVSYTMRQITPDANRLIAIGMNTSALNAVAHGMRSVSTAKTSPKKVTKKGKTMTQTALLRMATRTVVAPKSVR